MSAPSDGPEYEAVPLKNYIDAQLSEIRRAVDIAAAAEQFEGVPLKAYIEAILEEQKRALDMAASEREKAAAALRETDQRAMQTAEAEREKAANALRIGLDRAIKEGDDRLREHISNQTEQLRDQLEASRRETEIRFGASQEAILKAEVANERRFESGDAFREQLTDQTASFLRTEVADAQFREMRTAINDLTRQLDKLI